MKALLTWLVGRRLISLEKREYDWLFAFDDDTKIVAYGPWRLIAENRVTVTSEDHGQLFGLSSPVNAVDVVFSAVKGSLIKEYILSDTGDLSLHFASGGIVQFLVMSSGSESWEAVHHGERVICGGGGSISSFSSPSEGSLVSRTPPGSALLHTPQSVWIPIILALFLLGMEPVFSRFFYESLLAHGGLSASEDITTLINSDFGKWAVRLPFVTIFIAWALFQYPGRISLFFWNGVRPLWSLIWSSLFGLLALGYLISFWEAIRWMIPLEVLHIGLIFLLLSYLRAAILAKPS